VYGTSELADQYAAVSDPQFAHGRDLIELLALKRGECVLDVGCGTGRLALIVSERVLPEGRVVGVDPAPPRIEVARREGKGRAEFHVGQAEDLSLFGNAFFDTVYLNSVFGWVKDRPRCLAEAYRVLKVGGRLGIANTIPEKPNELRRLARQALDEVLGLTTTAAGGRAAADQRRPRGGRPLVDRRKYILDLMQGTGFSVRVFELRRYVSNFADADAIIAFMRATTYDNFLPKMTATNVERFAAALGRIIVEQVPESRRTNGIQLERHVLLAVADKPATDG
jgi:arsenite methyltransferase